MWAEWTEDEKEQKRASAVDLHWDASVEPRPPDFEITAADDVSAAGEQLGVVLASDLALMRRRGDRATSAVRIKVPKGLEAALALQAAAQLGEVPEVAPGHIVLKPPMSDRKGRVQAALWTKLWRWTASRADTFAAIDLVVDLAPGRVRSPDVALCRRARRPGNHGGGDDDDSPVVGQIVPLGWAASSTRAAAAADVAQATAVPTATPTPCLWVEVCANDGDLGEALVKIRDDVIPALGRACACVVVALPRSTRASTKARLCAELAGSDQQASSDSPQPTVAAPELAGRPLCAPFVGWWPAGTPFAAALWARVRSGHHVDVVVPGGSATDLDSAFHIDFGKVIVDAYRP